MSFLFFLFFFFFFFISIVHLQAELSIFISKLAMVLGIVQAFSLMLGIAHAFNLMLGYEYLVTCIFVAVLAYNILFFFVTSLIEKQVSGPSSWQIEKQVAGPSSWPEEGQYELQAGSSWPDGGQYELQAGSSWPKGVQFVLHTLPVHAKLVGDGDGMIVHVNIDLREFGTVPIEIQEAAIERREARAIRDYVRADALHKSIINCGYRVITANNEEILAREYRIRLRGIDAPEMNMEYGPEAKDALAKLIQEKPLTIHVYDKDPYDRLVGDVYCNGIFVQEKLLREGCAWHYEAFDKRSSFAQKEARNAGRGLWANPNPVKPWEFKKKERDRKIGQNRFTKGSTSANYL